MKIRNGFVSNSSSSSFIVDEKGFFRTVQDVAKYIIDSVVSEWGRTDLSYKDELKTLMNVSDPDTPVYFNTGGDETYIRKVDNLIIISTTQNIDFGKIRENALEKDEISEEFYRKFDHINEYDEEFRPDDPSEFDYYYHKFDDFLILQHNFYGRHAYIDDCPNCNKAGRGISRGWILKGGKQVCACKIDQIMRKQKLEKINENED